MSWQVVCVFVTFREKAELELQNFLEQRGRQDGGHDGGVIAEMLGESTSEGSPLSQEC